MKPGRKSVTARRGKLSEQERPKFSNPVDRMIEAGRQANIVGRDRRSIPSRKQKP